MMKVDVTIKTDGFAPATEELIRQSVREEIAAVREEEQRPESNTQKSICGGSIKSSLV
ncbi:hypothetical protein [Paenibacillus paeoniae]|uniref:hypothetical protein n=1 Tax=Paenibacillus paeoniae TaxID=2292705 RepID=UPI001403A880|nr:hypothetical protein [Paenibacillus paeoniae]